MPAPYLWTLPHSARLAYPFIRRGVREGLSSRAITTALQDIGKGIRRQTLLNIMRHENERIRIGESLKYIGRNKRIDVSRIPTAITKLRRQFSYEAEITGTNINTLLSETRHITIASSQNITRDEVESLAREIAEGAVDRYEIDVVDVRWMGVQKAAEGGLR